MSVTRNNNNNNNRRKSYSNNRSSNYKGNRGGNPAQIRKNATHNKAKYLDLAKNALLEGDKVTAENFFQHVHHYDTVLQELDEEMGNNNQNRVERSFENKNRVRRQQADNVEDDENLEAIEDEKEIEETDDIKEDKKPKRKPRKKVISKNTGRHEDISISEEEALLIMPQGIPGAVELPSNKKSSDK